MKKIKIGVVGVGHLGKFHVQKYVRMPDVEVVGIADIDPKRRESVFREYGIPAYDHHRRLLSGVDAVSIAVPTSEHAAVARDFLEHGIDVLIEKPIAASLAEAEELIELAGTRGCLLQVGHLERFNPVFLATKAGIRDPLFFESHRLSPFKGRALDVDVVLDLMIHDLDLILQLVPAPVEEIRAVGVPVISPKVDIANVRLQFRNGCVANLTASRISLVEKRKMRIFQPEGYLALDFKEKSYDRVILDPEKTASPPFRLECRRIEEADALAEELFSFVEAVRTRCRPLVCGEDGREALALAVRINEEIEKNLQAAREIHGAAAWLKTLPDPLPL
jgi:predicted dehydrogenase